MKFWTSLFLLLILSSCSSKKKIVEVKTPTPVEEKVVEKVVIVEKPKVLHWGYEGETGPANWSQLAPENLLCSEGQAQSPIDLIWKKPKKEGFLNFGYKDVPLKIVDNGHSIQINIDSGNWLQMKEDSFELMQIHFHSPSEHKISGQSYPLEMHFLHQNGDGKVAIVAVLFEVGEANAKLEAILSNLPGKKNEEKIVEGLQINPDLFLPQVRTYYSYQGSLTSPPCSEGVAWTVFNTPHKISQRQLEAFQAFYNGNNRPLQALGDRQVDNY